MRKYGTLPRKGSIDVLNEEYKKSRDKFTVKESLRKTRGINEMRKGVVRGGEPSGIKKES